MQQRRFGVCEGMVDLTRSRAIVSGFSGLGASRIIVNDHAARPTPHRFTFCLSDGGHLVAVTLQITKANGTVVSQPLAQGKGVVQLAAGDVVRVVDPMTGKMPAGVTFKKVGHSLVLEGHEGLQSVELSNFYGADVQNASLLADGVTITPGTDLADLASVDAGAYGAAAAAAGSDAAAAAAAQASGQAAGAAGAGATTAAPAAGAGAAAGTAEAGAAAGAAGAGAAAATVPAGAVLAGVAGVGIVGAAASGGGGGGSGGGGPTADTTAPAAPVVNDPVISADAVSLSGTAEANSTVTVTLNGVTRTVTADANGNWSTSYTIAEAGHDAQTASVTATDAAGNVSAATTHPVTMPPAPVPDTTAPDAPVIDIVAGDGVVNHSEAQAGVAITGTAEPGSTVTLTIDGTALQPVTAAADGTWTATVPASALAADGTVTVSATATDAAGNVSTAGTSSFVVDQTAPAVPTVTHVAVDNALNATEVAAGYTIEGTAAGAAFVNVTFGTLTFSNVAVDGNGAWTVTVPQGQVPADGAAVPVTATAVDAYGNESSASAAVDVLVDTAAPIAPAFVSVMAGGGISGNAEPWSHVLISDGTSSAPVSIAVGSTGNFIYTPPTPIAIGDTYTITTVDAAGNESAPVNHTAMSTMLVNGTSLGGAGDQILRGAGGNDVLIGDTGGGLRNGGFEYWDLYGTNATGSFADNPIAFVDPAGLGWTVLASGGAFNGGPAPVSGPNADTYGGQVMGNYFLGYDDGAGGTIYGTGQSVVTYAPSTAGGGHYSWDTSFLHEVGGSGITQTVSTVGGQHYTLSMDVSGYTDSHTSFEIVVNNVVIASYDGVNESWITGQPASDVAGADARTWSWDVTATGASTAIEIRSFIDPSTLANDPGVLVHRVAFDAVAVGGNDVLIGGGGHDLLWGQGGDDILYGGSWDGTTATPDAAHNVFVYSMQSQNGNDVIKDFRAGTDRIALIDVLDTAGTHDTPAPYDGTAQPTGTTNHSDTNITADDLDAGTSASQHLELHAAANGSLIISLVGNGGQELGSVNVESLQYGTGAGQYSTVQDLVAHDILLVTQDGFSDRLLNTTTPGSMMVI
ncbi:MAG: Ig-like domain-containing protein [Burkholderiaceae bacterium]